MGSYIFTVPSGCFSIRTSFTVKESGDIVWLKKVAVQEVTYNETIDTLNPIVVYDWDEVLYKQDIVKMDIPQLLAVQLFISISKTAGGMAKVGEVIVGAKAYLGEVRNDISLSLTDYSIKQVDEFGNYTILERLYSRKLSCALIIDNDSLDTIYNYFVIYRSIPIVWVVSEEYESMLIYGFYKDFSIVIPYETISECSLDVEGLV